MTTDQGDDMDTDLLALLARGVPWLLAKEAIASTRLDRDETHSLDER